MDILLVIGGVALIVGAVMLWHVYGPRITASVKGGPISPETNLSSTVDKMNSARNEALRLAAILEKELARVRSDLTAATSKLVPTDTAPKPPAT